MINILSLFSGTHSWTKDYENSFKYDVYSVDIEYRYKNTICRDILTWDYERELNKRISVVYASPPCNMYFTYMKNPPGSNPKMKQNEYTEYEKELSLKLVDKTIKIIEYYKPRYFIIENPRGRIIKHYESVCGYRPILLDYCMYGFDYKKPTFLYTNVPIIPKRCVHRKHDVSLKSVKHGIIAETFRAMIPPLLSKEIFEYIDRELIT